MKNRFSSHRHFGIAEGRHEHILNALVRWRAALMLSVFVLIFYSAEAIAQPYAYVTNSGSQSVSVIDTRTHTVVATIPVGRSAAGIAITPDGRFAYVAEYFLNNVSVINTSTNTVVASVPVGNRPRDIAITPDGGFAYVTNEQSNGVSVIDTRTNTVVANIPVGRWPRGIAITPDGRLAYVANNSSGNASVIDIASNTVIATVVMGLEPIAAATSPDGSFAYVVTFVQQRVSTINTSTNTVVASVVAGSRPVDIAITPDGRFAYVTLNYAASVSVIDLASNTVTTNVPVGESPYGIAITPDGNYAYVTLAYSGTATDTVRVISTATNTVVASIPVGNSPFGIAITPPLPEIDVQYKGVAIANGDDTPSTAEGTDFGSTVAAPGNFVARTFTIANTGSAALNLTGALPRVQVSGPHASDFTVLVPPASSVSAGSTTTFTVHFHPEAPGLRTATFSIANGDSDENPYEFVVQGTGEAPPPEFVFLANKITLEETKQNTPGGDMHSNGTLFIEKGEPSTYNSNLTAVGKITIEKSNTINGNVRSQTSISNSGKITGTKTIGAVAAVPLPTLSYSAGGPNKTVPSGGSLALAPGSYGIVTMSNNGTLKLGSGEYFITELRYSSSIEGGKIEIDLSSGDPVVINVVTNLQLGHEAAIVLLPNGEPDSKLVTFNTRQSTNANWGREAYLLGSFNAPNAKVTLVKNTQLRGSISAKEILVSNDCLFLHHDAPGSLPGPGDLPKPSFDEDEEVTSNQQPVSNYELSQNYPNPFNPTTTISFALPQVGEVTLSIYNTNGQLVKSLVAGTMNAGRHSLVWNATDDRGLRVASGVYLYVLKAGEFVAQRRLVLLK